MSASEDPIFSFTQEMSTNGRRDNPDGCQYVGCFKDSAESFLSSIEIGLKQIDQNRLSKSNIIV